MNVPHSTVVRWNGRSYTSKDGNSANKGSSERDHCVGRSKEPMKIKSGQEKKER